MKKDKLLAIGEALIDFAPKQIGVPLKDVSEFKKVVGGAPMCAVLFQNWADAAV